MLRDDIVKQIVAERERQLDIPGLEWDVRNSPNDWVAISASYCTQAACRKGEPPTAADFEYYLVQAAAVILAALEHLPSMIENKKLITSG